MSNQVRWVVGLLAVVLLGAIAVAVFAKEPPEHRGKPVIVCVDSTVSTDGVRDSYRADLEDVTGAAVRRIAHLYAAACGANATGEVNWTVDRQFPKNPYGESYLHLHVNEEMEGLQRPLDEILATDSKRDGTPLGEMLAVEARQCQQAGGDCAIYLFTDGEWADGILHLPREGISKEQTAAYLDAHESQLGDLRGSVVNFIGVGHGTKIGEARLNEAREIAEALVTAAHAEMGDWAVRR
jgi:hypothetical protein